jgi:hypothetical protein
VSTCCCPAGLEKDIGGLKREIRERDETIGDKERRIYELKKKNQELEKFKFVLDYKIKELKKQVGCDQGICPTAKALWQLLCYAKHAFFQLQTCSAQQICWLGSA